MVPNDASGTFSISINDSVSLSTFFHNPYFNNWKIYGILLWKIEKGASEAIYVNMPKTGLSKATEHIPVSKDTNTAQKRMNG